MPPKQWSLIRAGRRQPAECRKVPRPVANREEDNGDIGELANSLADLKAVHVRQANVQDDQVRSMTADMPASAKSATVAADDEASAWKDQPERGLMPTASQRGSRPSLV